MSDFFKRIFSAITAFFVSIGAFFGLAQKPKPVDQDPGWLLQSVPAYRAGVYCETPYNTGTGLENEVLSAPQTTSNMQLVRNTTLQDAADYGQRLESSGYRKTFSNQIGDIHFFAYQKDAQGIYYYFNAQSGETRVIDDCCNNVALDAFGYDKTTPEEPVTEPSGATEPFVTEPIDPQETLVNGENEPTTSVSMPTVQPTEEPPLQSTTAPYVAPQGFKPTPGVYQFCLPYYDDAHPDETRFAKNGMLYVIVLSDGKLVVIDGGSPYQCADRNIEAFMRFIREISGTSTGKKVRIALWYGTHCHADHIDFFYKLIHKYRREIKLERMMFNYQSHSVIAYSKRVDKFRNMLKKYYPKAKYVKCRSGYAFSFLDTRFEVLYTHEDCVSAESGALAAKNANDCCSVLKVTLGGKIFLFLGDSNTIVQDVLLRNYDKSVLRAQVLQASHHMINNLTKLYPVIAPTYVMCPQSKRRTLQTFPSYYTFLKLAPAQRMYFADQGIYGFLPQANGTISVVYQWFYCVGYDGSGL